MSDVASGPHPDVEALANIEVAGSDSGGKATVNGGRKHTEASKAKIALANKGKKPWNVGKKHSEETKARIAERTRVAMAKRKQAKLDAMGMTLDQYNESRDRKVKEKRKAKAKGGLTPEGRKRISESVKKRWQDPGYRERYTLANRGNRSHSDETKAKISAAIKAKWEDKEYRAKVNTSSHRPSQDVRNRISQTLKKKWQDPEFRQKMLKNSHERNDEWKHKVSDKIRELWKDPGYRNNVQQGIMASSSNRTIRPAGAKRPKAKRKPSVKKAKGGSAEALKTRKQIRTLCFGTLQHLTISSTADIVAGDLRWLVGSELWFEEKMRRRAHDETPLISDDELGAVLLGELQRREHLLTGEAAIKGVPPPVESAVLSALAACRQDQGQQGSYVDWERLARSVNGKRKSRAAAAAAPSSADGGSSARSVRRGGDVLSANIGELAAAGEAVAEAALSLADGEGDLASMRLYGEEGEDELGLYDDEYDDEWEVQEDEEDVIEVYDESGNLVGTYTDAEWANLKKSERG